MSILKNLFGKKDKENVPTLEEAIQRLHEVEELLLKRSELLETKIEEQVKIAKVNAANNKRGINVVKLLSLNKKLNFFKLVAIKALKTKKIYEKQLAQIDGTLTTLEYQRDNLESVNTNNEILKTMGYASQAFKLAHSGLNIDKINDLKDEMAEQQDLAAEIANAISRPTYSDEIDDVYFYPSSYI